MEALRYENVVAVLEQARRIDRNCELFGASTHQYRLNPPLDAAAVHSVEEQYHFTFPEDYFRFITQVANGGAGPDYGLMPFEESLMSGTYDGYRDAYLCSLGTPFSPRPMTPGEAESSSFAQDAYEREPRNFFLYEKEEDALCDTDGFFVLGTHGCQWDFGLVVSGERKGQVFTTDNEGGYLFQARSFSEFYQRWLDWLSDPENIRKELKMWRERPGKGT